MGTQAALETVPRVSSYEADKEAAREIQYSLVPSGNLISPGVEVAFRFSPFAEVGGDFTDFFQLPNGLVGLYLGDVVGKGLAAAMYAALVMGTIRGINKTGEDTAAVLTLLNKRLLVRPISGRYWPRSTLFSIRSRGNSRFRMRACRTRFSSPTGDIRASAKGAFRRRSFRARPTTSTRYGLRLAIPCSSPPTDCTNCEINATKISAGTAWASCGASAREKLRTNPSITSSKAPSLSQMVRALRTTSRQSL